MQVAGGRHSQHWTRTSDTVAAVNIELQVVPDCPHEADAERLLHAALADLGIDAVVRTRVILDEPEAVRCGFTGSPTFLLNGSDPFASPGRPVGLACRLYPTAEGVAGLPTLRDLRKALKQAADRAGRS